MLDVPHFDSLRGPRPFGEASHSFDAVEAAQDLSVLLQAEGAQADSEGLVTPASLDALRRSGLLLAPFSAAHGGHDLLKRDRVSELVQVLRLIGAGDLSMARLFEGHVNAVHLVERYGTPDQARSLARAVRAGALSGVWNAEGAIPLRAEPSGNELQLSGEKILASGAGVISHPIITPRMPDGGLTMLLLADVPRSRADLTGWSPLGMRASATGTVDFTGLSVSNAAQIGQPGDYLRQPTFSGGAWRFCAVHLGAAEHLVDLFRTKLRERGRTEDPYQKQRIAQATAACVTARLWISRAAELVACKDETADSIVAFVNLTRMVTERACLDVIEAVQRGQGLGAFIRPDPVERISRDLATYLRQPVPDAAMADAAATVLASTVPTFRLWQA